MQDINAIAVTDYELPSPLTSSFIIFTMELRRQGHDISRNAAAAERRMPVTAFETTDFECGRIKELEPEHLRIQQKTFTKWMNSFMEKNELLVRNADAVYIRDHVLGTPLWLAPGLVNASGKLRQKW